MLWKGPFIWIDLQIFFIGNTMTVKKGYLESIISKNQRYHRVSVKISMVNQLTGHKKKTQRLAFTCSVHLVDSVSCWYWRWKRKHYYALFPYVNSHHNPMYKLKDKEKWSGGGKKKVKKQFSCQYQSERRFLWTRGSSENGDTCHVSTTSCPRPLSMALLDSPFNKYLSYHTLFEFIRIICII